MCLVKKEIDMKRELIFQHGWGLSHHLWKKWEVVLPSQSKKTYLARGYFSSPSGPMNFTVDGGRILICHSLGLHLLTSTLIQEADLLVVVGGFHYFHGDAAAGARRSKKVVQVMLRQMNAQPEKVINAFYSRCGLAEDVPLENLNKELLLNDLKILDKNRLDLDPFNALPKILLLHGKEDLIVPVDRAEYLHGRLKKSELVIFEGAGHGLPFTHAEECVNTVLMHL